ncbi:GNAT family N-acetyltransferase [Anaerovibrio lipolyticus]|uniref:GNAT family N-acetyltransferase n=1 Tax=Anaerovibrio lipolyticus TaxID=82374 RepID=UPI0026F00069|nr:GNAT family N-acetyltransferase [Anaerovibrio lipolyticus]MBE6105660.1 GNAT family N-acetyltransferase [Anaerovibrio lipolyticus]
MNTEIKQLHIADIDALLAMRMEVLSHVFAEERKDMSSEEWKALQEANRAYYQENLENGGHIACFALVDGDWAGCGGICLYREMPSPDNHSGLCGYLMNIYTRELYRGKGIAKAVCQWLINEARVRGAVKIYLETSECGRNLYHSLGFQEMKDYLKL